MEANKDLKDSAQCQICGLKAHDLTSHITRIHNGVDEYKHNFPNTQIRSVQFLKDQSTRASGNKNPAYQHGGKFSPFSQKFVGKKDLKIHQRVAENRKINKNDNTQLEYYTSRGYTTEEAQKTLSKRQSTFSLEICIQEYGEEKGKERWLKRQEQWIKALSEKTPEERLRINRLKASPGANISSAEYEILSILTPKYPEIIHQHCISIDTGWIYDFVYQTKIIEYHGDYWHCNPNKYQEDYYHQRLRMTAKEKWQKDKLKEDFAKTLGYEYLTIWECEYKKDPKETLNKCLEFLCYQK